jgi:cytosine/adenosine deaminase-related metal-dependent hydrolase
MATIDGARDLGFDRVTGSLAPGKRADLILVRTGAPNMGDIGDPYDALVQLAQPSDVELVMVDGRILHRNRQFTALDYGKLLADGAQSGAALKAKANWS